MEEVKINLETAKLAKEKGFDIPCENYYVTYIDDDNIDLYNYEENRGSNFAYLRKNDNDFEYSAPTQSLLQKWLREVHNIHIELKCFTDNTWDGILIYENAPYEWDDKTAPVEAENCKTYEEALEICLQKALKLI